MSLAWPRPAKSCGAAAFACIGLLASFASGPARAAEPGLYLELGVGLDARIEEGSNPRSVIRLRYEARDGAWWQPDVYELDHHSSVREGAPFNHRPDTTADQLSVIWRIRIGANR
jgi:hypothetical protein